MVFKCIPPYHFQAVLIWCDGTAKWLRNLTLLFANKLELKKNLRKFVNITSDTANSPHGVSI
jgi:hypothetical protein